MVFLLEPTPASNATINSTKVGRIRCWELRYMGVNLMPSVKFDLSLCISSLSSTLGGK